MVDDGPVGVGLRALSSDGLDLLHEGVLVLLDGVGAVGLRAEVAEIDRLGVDIFDGPHVVERLLGVEL